MGFADPSGCRIVSWGFPIRRLDSMFDVWEIPPMAVFPPLGALPPFECWLVSLFFFFRGLLACPGWSHASLVSHAKPTHEGSEVPFESPPAMVLWSATEGEVWMVSLLQPSR